MPALATIARDSYSKNRIGAPEGSGTGRAPEPEATVA